MPEFSGLKLAHDTPVCAAFPDIHKIEIERHDRILFDKPGVVGSGGNSGYQALNIAAQFGSRRILLVGFDMHLGSGAHWYGHNRWHGANNPVERNVMRWRDAFTAAAPALSAMGIEVINASPDSALRCFEHKSIDAALSGWGL